jgi:hypothetical protein
LVLREPRGRVGPRLFDILGYAHGVTTNIVGPSSRREVARSGGNIAGTMVAWERGDFDRAKMTSSSWALTDQPPRRLGS